MGKKAVHDEVLELLPWFVNDSLGDRERDLVMGHLRDCSECREERDQLQALEKTLTEDDLVVPDYRFSYKKVLARIETAEKNRESTAGLEASTSRNWIPVAGVAAGLVMAVLLVAGLQAEKSGEFRTLTTTSPPAEGALRQVELTFEQPIQAQTMRKALIETRSNIISGPDLSGTYLVEMQVPASDSEAFLESIQSIEGVEIARFSSAQVSKP